jgi:hypothetical protein
MIEQAGITAEASPIGPALGPLRTSGAINPRFIGRSWRMSPVCLSAAWAMVGLRTGQHAAVGRGRVRERRAISIDAWRRAAHPGWGQKTGRRAHPRNSPAPYLQQGIQHQNWILLANNSEKLGSARCRCWKIIGHRNVGMMRNFRMTPNDGALRLTRPCESNDTASQSDLRRKQK